MKRWLWTGIALMSCLLFAGCVPPQIHAVEKVIRQECARDGRARWLRARPDLQDILIAQTEPPPAGEKVTPDETTVPRQTYALRLGTVPWFPLQRLAKAFPGRALYAFVPANPLSNPGAPEGVYMFPKPTDTSAPCPPVARLPGTKCTAALYVGGVSETPYRYYLVWTEDRTYRTPDDAQKFGPISRSVEKLAGRDGVEYAEAVQYRYLFAEFGTSCGKNYGVEDLIADSR